MAFRRETMVLRGPSGTSMGFVIWEQGRQGSLRCQFRRLVPGSNYRVLWATESGALRPAGDVVADGSGNAEQTLLLAGDAVVCSVALAQTDGGLCAQAMVSGCVQPTWVQLQAAISALDRPIPVEPDNAQRASAPAERTGTAKKQSRRPDEEFDIPRGVNWWRGPAWPPPPGLPGAGWKDGRWMLP